MQKKRLRMTLVISNQLDNAVKFIKIDEGALDVIPEKKEENQDSILVYTAIIGLLVTKTHQISYATFIDFDKTEQMKKDLHLLVSRIRFAFQTL